MLKKLFLRLFRCKDINTVFESKKDYYFYICERCTTRCLPAIIKELLP
jgi:hypothetical protein